MAVLDALIERNAPGTGVISDTTEVYARGPEPVNERRWRCWAAAERALRHEYLADADRWLSAAAAIEDGEPSPLWVAEMLVTRGRILWAEHEPSRALDCLESGWERWRIIWDAFLAGARDPRDAVVGRWVAEMFEALVDDRDDLDPGSPQVLVTWMSERLVDQLDAVGREVIRLAGEFGDVGTARSVTEWLLKLLQVAVADPPRRSLTSTLHLYLGNALDDAGRPEEAMCEFALAIREIERMRGVEDVDSRIAPLMVNQGNALLQLDRVDEAYGLYENAIDTFKRKGMREPELRTRYARAYARWVRGERDVEPELRDIVDGYETLVQEAGRDGAVRAARRQTLEPPYRLLLGLLARRFERDPSVLDELLTLAAVIRDDKGLAERDGDQEAAADALSPLTRRSLGVLESRLGRIPDAVLLLAEPAVDGVVLVVLRGGVRPPEDRAAVAVAGAEFSSASWDLITASRAASDALITRQATARQLDSGPVEAAAERVAALLPRTITDALRTARTVFWSPGALGGGDELPFEIIPLNGRPIGLQHTVVRVPSLHALAEVLAPNRFNSTARSAAIVVRAAEPPGTEGFADTDDEARSTLRALAILGLKARFLDSPAPAEVLEAFGEGARVLHYIGHGVAGGGGEHLVLGVRESLAAQELTASLRARPPFTYLSACLVGRARHILGGAQWGFGVALLEAGAPGLIAATYAVPSHLCREIAVAFQRAAWRVPVGEAMRLAREQLAADGWHPVAWGAFALWGDPEATIAAALPTAGSAVHTLDWPALITRALATGDEGYHTAILKALDAAAEGLPNAARTLQAVAAAITSKTDEAVLGQLVERLAEFDLEAAAALRLFMADVRIRALTGTESPADTQQRLLQEISRAIGVALALSDSYALVHFVALHSKHVNAWIVDQVRLLELAEARLGWLSSDAGKLTHAAEEIQGTLGGLRNSLVFDAPTMLGVDPELFARADEGDERALKELAHQVLARDASAATQLEGAPDWPLALLRFIATGSQQSLSDVLGTLKARRARGSLDERLGRALTSLLAEYTGPGAAAPAAYAEVRAALRGDDQRLKVIDAFELNDAFQSDPATFALDQAEAGCQLSEELGHPGAGAYFGLVKSQILYQQGDIGEAKDVLLAVVHRFAALADQDSEYTERLLDAAQNAAAFAVMDADFENARVNAALLRDRGEEARLGSLKKQLLG